MTGRGRRHKEGKKEEEGRERRKQERRKERKEASEGGQSRQRWSEKGNCVLEHATVPTQVNKVTGAEEIFENANKKRVSK